MDMKTCIKQSFVVAALVVVVAVLVACPSEAQFIYTANNGTVTITGYTGTNDVVVIPSTIDGLPVTSIGTNAFQNAPINAVSIPNSVISIGDYAFASCYQLTNLTIGNGVSSIGELAFAEASLSSVTIPDSVTNIGFGAFEDCAPLTAITVGAQNTTYSSLDGVLFDKRQSDLIEFPTGLSGSYAIPDTVTNIETGAFSDCSGLTMVTIPTSLSTIKDAFWNCIRLTNVIIPDSVTNIGYYAFSGCGLTSLTLPSSVITIGDDAFRGCGRLTNVTISDSVTTIGDYAFSGCGLTSVTLPSSVTTLGDSAFLDCSFLADATIGSNLISIQGSAFQNCFSLTNVTMGSSITNLGNYAFSGCGLSSVMIPSGVITIGDHTFEFCRQLTNVTMGDSVTTIGNSTFANSSLISATIGNSVTSIGDYAFYGSSLSSVTLPNSLTSIGDDAFEGCSSLTSLTIGSNVTSIGSAAFNGTRLNSVTMPNSVTSIGGSAFAGCYGLTNVTIGNGVTAVGDSAFDQCGLTSVTIPNSVTNIGLVAFDCPNLTAIEVAAQNPTYSGLNGVLFNKGQTELVEFPPGLGGGYTIPNSVTTIGAYAFESCYQLTDVTIGNGVANIGNRAFEGCQFLMAFMVAAQNATYSSLDGVLFDKSRSELVEFPPGLAASYTIPDTVTTIGNLAFAGCGLTTVTIPASVTLIGPQAFTGCRGLTNVFSQGNAPTVDPGAFLGPKLFQDPAVVYYLPGTTGWRTNFAGLPTAVWSLPYPLVLPEGIGIQSNQFSFTVSWATNLSVVVEASTDLRSDTWIPIQTNALHNGVVNFTDPDWTNHPRRFYRVRSQ
jgi:hypothetical protein